MIFVKKRQKSSIDLMGAIITESYNTHTVYHSIKDTIPKNINKIITAFRITMLQENYNKQTFM